MPRATERKEVTSDRAVHQVPFIITFDGSSVGTCDVPGVTVAHVATGRYTVSFPQTARGAWVTGLTLERDAASVSARVTSRGVSVSTGKPVLTLQLQSAAGTDAQVASCAVTGILMVRDILGNN